MEDDNTTPTPLRERPLGYWLRAVDARLSARFADAFEAEGIGRREWMLLSVLAGDVDAPGLAERLAHRGKKLRSLRERGWVTENDGTWTLTDEGRAAKDRLTETVTAIRQEVAGAVSAEDFAITLTSLEAIARTLGWDEQNVRGGRHGFGPRGHGRGGFRPGFGGHRFGDGFGRPGFGPGFARDGFGPEGRRHGGRPGFAPDDSARHDHPGFHPNRGHHGGCGGHGRHSAPVTEEAYERGFRAGFAARSSDTADA